MNAQQSLSTLDMAIRAFNLATALNAAGRELDGEACRSAFKCARAIVHVLVDGWGTTVLQQILDRVNDPDDIANILQDMYGNWHLFPLAAKQQVW